jgi:hypothetical protein
MNINWLKALNRKYRKSVEWLLLANNQQIVAEMPQNHEPQTNKSIST